MRGLRDLLSCDDSSAKIGLALSGGGFRAAFFHVGVLARLAEIGVLPKVEVISTVSGGSIIGAAYYILLKQRLESGADGAIGQAGYVELVEELEPHLRQAVQEEIRGRVFTDLASTARMLFSPSYSRSDRIGELYDRHLYRPIWTGGGNGPIKVRQLRIAPDGDQTFDPDEHNDDRKEKVPVLLINATTLNTGHNWRFEAVRMGEPLPDDRRRREIVKETDKNMQLDQGYFDPQEGQPAVPGSQVDFPLGAAVAASAGVPGVFHPLSVSDMYWDEGEPVRVQLVDGGVQDNQGVQGLLDRGCTRLIVSDASGQLDDKRKPLTWLPVVAKRSIGISSDRIRDEQLTYLPKEGRTYALMHLRKGLRDRVIAPGTSWTDASGPAPEYSSADFEVDAEVQMALSRVRTDLDFFTDTEALSLELDGYLMSDFELKKRGFDELGDGKIHGKWPFTDFAGAMRKPDDDYLRRLRAGAKRFTRLLALKPRIGWPLAIGAAIALLATPYAVWRLVDVIDTSCLLSVVIAVALLALLALCATYAWGNLSVWTRRLYGA